MPGLSRVRKWLPRRYRLFPIKKERWIVLGMCSGLVGMKVTFLKMEKATEKDTMPEVEEVEEYKTMSTGHSDRNGFHSRERIGYSD